MAAVLAVLLAACGEPGGLAAPQSPALTTTTIATTTTRVETSANPFTLPDISARPVTVEDLTAMIPPGFTTRERTNGDVILDNRFDPDDEAADVLATGRVTGVSATGPVDTGTAHLWIDLLGDPAGASHHLTDTVGDLVKRMGGTHDPAVAATSVGEFPVAVGEDAIGLTMDLDAPHGFATAIVFRLGRIVVYAAIGHDAEADLRVAAQYLAEDVAGRVVEILTATPVATAVPAPNSHRFETRYTIEASGIETIVVDIAGIIDGLDVSCTITAADDTGVHTTMLTRLADDLWVVTDGATPRPVAGGNLAERVRLALCPPWPLDIGEAGMSPTVDTAGDRTVRRRMNGVNALGYAPDPIVLGDIVGLPLAGVAVEGFSFWVAEDAPWLVELGFTATGPAESLRPLLPPEIGAEGIIRLVVRHRVSDVGGAGPITSPAIPGATTGS